MEKIWLVLAALGLAVLGFVATVRIGTARASPQNVVQLSGQYTAGNTVFTFAPDNLDAKHEAQAECSSYATDKGELCYGPTYQRVSAP